MEDLVKKVGHRIGEVADRAVRSLHSKLTANLTTIPELLQIENGAIAGLLLHWINERQTESDIQTLNSGLKMCLEIAIIPQGHELFTDLQAVEFFNSYYKYVPSTLQATLTGILNCLISPAFVPVLREKDDIFPAFDHVPKQKIQVPMGNSEESIGNPCEYPPVLLCESDEKIIFDLAVTFKFANAEEIIDACEETRNRILKDFPFESLLQHADLLRSIVGVVKASSQKNNEKVAIAGLVLLKDLMRKMRFFTIQVKKPEMRNATCMPKKILIKAEYLEISVPCLRPELWEIGTPGPTLSILSAVEYIITELPMDNLKTLAFVIEVWEEAEFFFTELFAYPKVVMKMLDLLSESIFFHTEKSNSMDKLEAGVFIRKIVDVAEKIILKLPVGGISQCMSKGGQIVKYLAEFIVFQGENCEKLLPYLEEIDKSLVDEYKHAESCVQAVEAYKTMKQLLLHEQVLPISNLGVFSKAIDFFKKILPVLEFQGGGKVPAAILDLNCYSLYIEKNSTSDPKKSECQELLLGLLCSSLPAVVDQTLQVIEEALERDIELTGIASGTSRKSLVKQVVLQSNFLSVLLVKHRNGKILTMVLENPEDYEVLLPLFTVIQSLNDERLEGILHFLTSANPPVQPLRFIRDLFSVNPSRRAVALMVLRHINAPENIQKEWRSVQDNMWDKDSNIDPVTVLAQNPELEGLNAPKNICSHEEIQNLLSIYKSTTLETNLKVAAAEQIILYLLAGLENTIDDIITAACANLCEDIDDRYTKRLISKSLQILVVVGLKSESKAKKLYTAPLKFLCSLLPYIFSTYDQIRHYSLHLLFILSFSAHTPRNRFIPTDIFTLLPSASPSAFSVPIISILTEGFLMPFPIQLLTPEYYPTSGFLKYWEFVPSSKRVHGYVNKEKVLEIDADAVLDYWGKKVSQCETHGKILEVCGYWQSTVKVANGISNPVCNRLLSVKSEIINSMLSVIRTPSVNYVEDSLHVSIHQVLRSIVLLPIPTRGQLEFIMAVSQVLQKSCLPFLFELTEYSTRKTITLSILLLLQSLLPFHGCSIFQDQTLSVLTKFQLEPGPNSLISLLYSILSTTDDSTLTENIINTLIIITDHPQLSVTLDVKTSPIIRSQISDCIRIVATKLIPFINPTTFINKSTGKRFLQLLSRIPDLCDLDSYMWAIRLSEDRDAGMRILAWSFLSLKSMESYELHSSVLDIALEVVFGLHECYGVKIQAAKFLCAITEVLMNSENHSSSHSILNAFFKYAVISHVKSMLYENAGPPPTYFAVIVTLLNNLLTLQREKVIAVCIQIDIWDGLMRVLRPGAMVERANNEGRRPCKPGNFQDYEEILLALLGITGFLTNVIKNDAQVLSYLLESTHFLSNVLAWVEEILAKFDQNNEQVYSKALLAVVNCMHMSVFKSQKSQRHLSEFSYQNFVKILDCSQSKDLKLATSRMITAVLPFIPPEDCDGLLLHLISLYKSENSAAEQSDLVKSLSSFLFYHEKAKIIAISTGFQDFLLENGLRLLSQISSLEVQKVKKKEEENFFCKELQQTIILFKLWAANSNNSKVLLSYKDGKIGSLFKLLFAAWPLGLRREDLLKLLLETICTVTSACEESKKACAVVQESRQSLLSLVIEYTSRPNSASEPCFQVALKILGSLCSCKESLRLLIKSKYPQGLALRLLKEWNEIKNPEVIPNKSPYIIEFLTTFAFFEEGQKVLAGISGLADVVIEVLDRFSKTTVSCEAVENSLLLLRNLAFSNTNKPHLVANQMLLPLILSFISSPSQKPRLRKLASSALWALLYHYQKFKGVLSNAQVLSELQNVYKEVTRDAERCKDKDVAAELKSVSENLNSVLKICLGQ